MKQHRMTLALLLTIALMACGGGDDATAANGEGGNGGSNPPGTLPTHQKSRSLAFPGADGAGKNTRGGAEEEVYIVTNTNDSGLGSLRMGLQGNHRTIVFAIGGQINLKSPLAINQPNITIAGQTAPGDGITIAGYPVSFGSKASNLVIRFLRFRMGDQNSGNANFDADDGDAFGGKDANNIIIDHCSISYSSDECASFSRVKNFTLQYCIISESMKNGGHTKKAHGYGGIWGGANATYHHNLLAHHDSRNPRFDHSYVGHSYRGPIDYVNNVVYNWGSNSTYGGETDSESNVFHINFVGNYYKAGPNTNSKAADRLMQLTTHCTNCVAETGNAYPANIFLEGNLVNGSAASWDNITMDGSETRDKTALKTNARLSEQYTTGLIPLSYRETAANAYNSVLQYAGASKERDGVDKRIIDDVKNTTGAIIDKVSDNMEKYYPTLAPGTPITDTDNDGMPDSWEKEQIKALGVSNVSIEAFLPTAYNLSARYTNLEVYMNELVSKMFPEGAGADITR